MKTILLFLLCFPLFVKAQTEDLPVISNEDGQAKLTMVVVAPGSQDQLFVKTKDWLYKTYNSGKTVEQFEDKASGHLVAKARTSALKWKAGLGIVNDAGDFSYNLTIDVKDGKARMIINNIIYQKGTAKNSMLVGGGANLADEYPINWPRIGKKAMIEHWNEIQVTTKAELLLIAKSFQAALKSDSTDF